MGNPVLSTYMAGLVVEGRYPSKVTTKAFQNPRLFFLCETLKIAGTYLEVSLNYCSQNGGNISRAPYYNGNPNIGPRIIGNLDQSPYGGQDWTYPSAICTWP